jgi:hypothetical protein
MQKHDLMTQRLVLNGELQAILKVAASDKPNLYEAIKERLIDVIENDTVDAKSLPDLIGVPVWYKRGDLDIGIAMRSYGYTRHGDVWKFGAKAEKRCKKRPGRRTIGSAQLKTLRIDQIELMIERCHAELARRAKMR